MPRTARIKSFDSIYHVMVRSNDGLRLFKEDKDKNTFLKLVKGYQKEFGFKIYAYCLMTNHAHFIIDANGADISKFMHGINQRYAQFYNKKYKRHGHVFWDRFKSIIVDNDKYLITLSAYIHNNPKVMKRYKNCIEKYEYSTLGVYLGLRKDPFSLVDESFIMQLFSEDGEKARKMYLKLAYVCNNKAMIDTVEFKNEKSQYRSERVILVRDFPPEEILEFVSKCTGIDKRLLHAKSRREATEGRALCVFLMRYFCDFRHKDICRILGYISASRVSKLGSIGIRLAYEDIRYRNIIGDFLKQKTV